LFFIQGDDTKTNNKNLYFFSYIFVFIKQTPLTQQNNVALPTNNVTFSTKIVQYFLHYAIVLYNRLIVRNI